MIEHQSPTTSIVFLRHIFDFFNFPLKAFPCLFLLQLLLTSPSPLFTLFLQFQGIFISKIAENGPAAADGRLRVGDKVLMVCFFLLFLLRKVLFWIYLKS